MGLLILKYLDLAGKWTLGARPHGKSGQTAARTDAHVEYEPEQ